MIERRPHPAFVLGPLPGVHVADPRHVEVGSSSSGAAATASAVRLSSWSGLERRAIGVGDDECAVARNLRPPASKPLRPRHPDVDA